MTKYLTSIHFACTILQLTSSTDAESFTYFYFCRYVRSLQTQGPPSYSLTDKKETYPLIKILPRAYFSRKIPCFWKCYRFQIWVFCKKIKHNSKFYRGHISSQYSSMSLGDQTFNVRAPHILPLCCSRDANEIMYEAFGVIPYLDFAHSRVFKIEIEISLLGNRIDYRLRAKQKDLFSWTR